MKTKRVKQLKSALEACVVDGERLSRDDASELLDLLNRVFPPKASLIKDASPMIGENPFRRKFSESDIVTDGDHLRVDGPDARYKLYGLLNESIENGND